MRQRVYGSKWFKSNVMFKRVRNEYEFIRMSNILIHEIMYATAYSRMHDGLLRSLHGLERSIFNLTALLHACASSSTFLHPVNLISTC